MSATPPKRSMHKADGILTCVLSPDNAATPDRLYDTLSKDLNLPDHFGRNLDALYDCLTGDVDRPFEITVRQPGRMRDLLGATWDEIAVLLLDVATERDDATVILTNR